MMPDKPSVFDMLVLEMLAHDRRIRNLDRELHLVADLEKRRDEQVLRSFRNRLAHVDFSSLADVSEEEFVAVIKASQELAHRVAHHGNASQDLVVRSGPGRGRSLQRAPGIKLDAIAAFVCSKKTYERVFQQTLADMQNEYFEALKDGHKRKAQWIMWRGRLSFVCAALTQIPVSAIQLVVRLWKAAS